MPVKCIILTCNPKLRITRLDIYNIPYNTKHFSYTFLRSLSLLSLSNSNNAPHVSLILVSFLSILRGSPLPQKVPLCAGTIYFF